jgi:hypothetical protein
MPSYGHYDKSDGAEGGATIHRVRTMPVRKSSRGRRALAGHVGITSTRKRALQHPGDWVIAAQVALELPLEVAALLQALNAALNFFFLSRGAAA